MTLQALREKVGDFTFNRILRDWATQNRYGNVTTPQFIAHAEQISGQDLTAFFDAWLYQVGKPTSWDGHGGVSPSRPGSPHGRSDGDDQHRLEGVHPRALGDGKPS